MKTFFHFHQNNSGGSFDHSESAGIGENVWVEADDAIQANAIAENKIGLYWNGVESGTDCKCCGDRWSTVYGEGEDAPAADGYYANKAYVHYADGRIEKVAV